jgi:hypothetical protein
LETTKNDIKNKSFKELIKKDKPLNKYNILESENKQINDKEISIDKITNKYSIINNNNKNKKKEMKKLISIIV